MESKDIKWEKLKKCYLCGSSKLNLYLKDVRYWENPISFNFNKCSKCGFVFINPRPHQKYISNFYKSESYWGQNINSEKELKQQREESFEKIYSLIEFDNKKSIFDIGAGTGLFLSKFEELGWDATGIEYSKDAVIFAKKAFGVSLLNGDLLNKNIKSKYDYIVLNNALEHLYDPLQTLNKVQKMLKKDGKVIIAVPNIDSLGFTIFGKDWYPLQPPIHLSQFTPETINLILKKSGLKVIHIDHNNPIHAKFSIFESYRSWLTKRNTKKIIKVQKSLGEQRISKDTQMNLIKNIGVFFGNILSYLISYLGFVFKRGENIIIYVEKK